MNKSLMDQLAALTAAQQFEYRMARESGASVAAAIEAALKSSRTQDRACASAA
jgi:hypothetical protein